MRCSILALTVLVTVALGARGAPDAPPQQSGPVKPDFLVSATTCRGGNPLTLTNGLPSGVISSRSVPMVRWITAEAPGMALQILEMNAVSSDRLARFMTGLLAFMQRQDAEFQAHRLSLGFVAYEEGPTIGSRFVFSICPQPEENAVLTWEAAHRVLSSLYWYMVMGAGFRLLQYHALTRGATPAQDVQFAAGAIAMSNIGPIPGVAR